jgi:AcrR family transcriptional regulator
VLEGVVAGLARIGRVSVLNSEEGEIEDLVAETADWILSLRVPSGPASGSLTAAEPSPNGRMRASVRLHDGSANEVLGDDRAMILVAAFRIARDGYQHLSVPRICREAGVPRRSFNRHFHGVQDCLFSAVEERLGKVLAAATRGRLAPGDSGAGFHDLLETLSDAVQAEPQDARVLFVETFEAGTQAIDSHDDLLSRLARAVRTIAPEGRKPSKVAAEASTAAGWAILRRQVTEPSLARSASHSLLVLAPAVGGRRGGRDKKQSREVLDIS